MKRDQRGYNLVEVLIAMAILATVLIAIAGLFLMGRKNVYSGKQMTRAVAVATEIMEDMSPLTRADLEDSFGLDSATAGAPGNVDMKFQGSTVRSFANSYGRFAWETAGDQSNATKDPDGYLQEWYDKANEQLANAEIHMILTPLNNAGAAAANFEVAPVVQVQFFISWTEQTRQRQITFDTVKVDRTQG